MGVRDCAEFFLAVTLFAAWGTPASGQPIDFILEWAAPGWSRGIAADGQRVLVVEQHDAMVWVFDHYGMLVDNWGGQGSDPGHFGGPWGVEIGPDDRVYVADRQNNRVQKLTFEGVSLAVFEVAGAVIFDVALNAGGDIFLTDNEGHRVVKLDRSGSVITTWGSLGGDDGQFVGPRGIAVGPSGDVYVSSSLKIQRFRPDGAFVLSWPTGDFSGGIEVDRHGNVYRTSFDGDSVIKTTTSGEFLAEFQVPTAIDVAAVGNGDLFAIDTNGGRVLRFLDALPIFADGFESGYLNAWTNSVP